MGGKHSDDNVEVKVRVKEDRKTRRKKRNKTLKIIGIVFLVLLVIIIGIAVGAYLYVRGLLGNIESVELNEEELGISEETEKNLSRYRNIAVFGIDTRADDNGEGLGNRSDCIMIISIDNETKEVKLISVYRDTYVQIDGHGLDKITHAYSYGGAQLAIKTLNTNLDLNIKEFVTVNFDSVAEAVDQLGGVDINITNEEVKYINSYIDATSKIIGKSSSHITTAGWHTLDGVQAVAYSRIRYTAGGDYKRTERMRDVLQAMLTKLKSKNVGQINTAVKAFLKNEKIYSTFDADEIIGLIPTIIGLKVVESVGWPYEVRGITLDRWYGVPVTLESNVIKLHKEIFNDSQYVLPDTIKKVSDSIVSKTGYN